MTRDDGVDRTHRVGTLAFGVANRRRFSVARLPDDGAPWWPDGIARPWGVCYGCGVLTEFPTHAEAIAYAHVMAGGGDHEAGMEAAERARAT